MLGPSPSDDASTQQRASEEWRGVRFLSRMIGLLMLPGLVGAIFICSSHSAHWLIPLIVLQIVVCVTLTIVSLLNISFRKLLIALGICIAILFVNGGICTYLLFDVLANK